MDDAAPKILRAVADCLGWDVGALWVVDPALRMLRCASVWRADPSVGEAFETATRATAFPKGTGLPGRVWESGKSLWVEDVVVDANFPRAPVALADGIHGAFAFPIVTRDEVLGVVEFFSRKLRRPDDAVLRLFTTVGGQIGQFIARQRTEDALRRNEQELTDFFENGPVGLHWVDADGRIVRVNRTELEMLGYRREEYLGKHVSEFYVDASVADDVLARLAKGETLRAYEARLRHRDGSFRWVQIDSNVYREAGELTHTRCFTRDVTDQKAAEGSLRESEERTRQILANALDASITMNGAGSVVSWNRRAEEVFGWSAKDAVGKQLQRLIIPEVHRPMHEDGLARFLKTGEGPILEKRIETTALRRDGSEFAVELTVTPVRVRGSWTFHAFVRDITERKRAEETLRRAEEASRKRAEALRKLVAAASAPPSGYFERAAAALADGLAVRVASIVELDPADATRGRSVVVWVDGRRATPSEGPLAGTPAEVALKGTCFYRDAAAERFPGDPLLARIGAQSYLGTALRGPAGKIFGVIAVAHDAPLDEGLDPLGLLEVFAGRIAAEIHRRRTEETLRESRERFRLLVQGVEGYALVTMDTEGRLTSWNAGAERLDGWRSEEMLGRDAGGLAAPDDATPDAFAEARRVAGTREAVHRTGWGLRKDGNRFPADTTLSALRDEQGRLHGFALLSRDRS